MTIPYTFAGATTAIPLANLDANFASPITLGNVAMTLSNTYTSIGNLTLTNVTISSGTINSAITQTYGNANAVVFTNSSNVATTSTSLYFDGTNLGIGTSSPSQKLDVNGTIRTAQGAGDSARYIIYSDATNWSYLTYGADAIPRWVTGNNSGGTSQTVAFGSTSSIGGAFTENLRLNSSANLVLKGGTVGANGVGVTFPASQSASSDANCLDDYEEGTWSPTLATDGTQPTGVVYNIQSATYIKVGKLVQIEFIMLLTSKGVGANGTVLVSGLPFVHANNTTYPTATGTVCNLSSNVTSPYLQVNPNVNYLVAISGNGTSAATGVLWSNAGNNLDIRCTLCYQST